MTTRMATHGRASGTRTARRLEMLRETWHYARTHCPFYAETLPDLALEDVNLDSLRRLPLRDRRFLAEHSERIRCRRGIPDFLSFTGGTTGMPRVVYGTREQLEHGRRNGAAGSPSDALLPLCMSTDGGHHGTPPIMPGERGLIQLPLRNRKNYEWAWHLLSSRFDYAGYEDRVSLLMLPTPALKKLVHFLAESGRDGRETGLVLVGAFSHHLSAPWRRHIEEVLGAPVVDHFGFSEISRAIARECAHCGWMHFNDAVVWEVVDCWSDTPIDEGLGKLAATSLYPYVNDQILFRYVTDDIVELGPYCPHGDDRGFKYRGRMSQSLTIEDNGRNAWVLTPPQVLELIDFDPHVARLEERRFSGITLSGDDGFPKWRARVDPATPRPCLTLEIEMKASPYLFADVWNRLRARVREGLLDSNHDLRRLVFDGRLDFRVEPVAPGGLREEEVATC